MCTRIARCAWRGWGGTRRRRRRRARRWTSTRATAWPPRNYGAALQALGRDEEAVAFLGGLPQPGVEVRLTLGRGLLNLRRHAQALAVFEDVLRADPRSAKALVGRGLACAGLGRGEEALRCFDAAAALDPASAEALSNRAVTLKRLGRLAEAAASAEAALRIAPENLDARINLGNAQSLLGEHAAAVANLRLAVARDGTSRDAQMNLGNALYHAQEIAAAIPHFAAAAQGAAGPLAVQALASLTFARLQCCDWTGLADARAALVEAIGRDEGWGAPFAMLSIVDDPAIHHACAARQLREAFPIARRVVAPAPAGGRIRVGYFSSDLRVHAVGQAMARLLELHDRSAFEIHAFAIGRPVQDALRTRIAAGVEHFHECGGLADDAVLALAREVGLDIAVDLNGHTGNARTALFAQGLAPVQVNYLGYPGTMGAPFMDYILADATVIPEGAEAAFSEAVVRLPDTYLPTDDRREISETPLTREDAGLPSGAFVFCVFNNGYKIQPEAFAIWMRLLAQLPGAVLWLREEQALATRNLRAAAADHGIDPARLVFAGKVPHPEHLARHRLADLFLDALPYNAHTTAADALGAGLPVLTQAGRAFAGRVGASLLQAVGLPELVTTSPEAHERLALDLATDPARLGAIRQRLAARLPVAPLFDTPRLARAIERAFAAMQARALAGLPPAGFTVARPPGPG